MKMTLFRLSLVAVLAFLAGIAFSAQRGSTWPDSLDAVTAAPKNHKVLYEDDHVRVLEVTVQPGETENMHTHKYPSVFIYDAAQPRLRNRRADGSVREMGRNFEGTSRNAETDKLPAFEKAVRTWRETDLPAAIARGWPTAMAAGPDTNGPHQITDLDTFPHHFYRFEFKRLDGNDIMKRTSY